jgi:hypothetical protein
MAPPRQANLQHPCSWFFFVMAHRLEYAPQSPRRIQASSVVVIVGAPWGDRLVFKTIIQPRRHGIMPPHGVLDLFPWVHPDDPCCCSRSFSDASFALVDPALRVACDCCLEGFAQVALVVVFGPGGLRISGSRILSFCYRACHACLPLVVVGRGWHRICSSCPLM